MSNKIPGIHYIRVVSKYYKRNKSGHLQLQWYTDNNGIRYSEDDIKYIILNKVVPLHLAMIYGYTQYAVTSGHKQLYRAEINMKLLKSGKLKCTTGTLISKMVYNSTPVCIINEDENSGSILCKNILIRGMQNIDFHFYTCNGNKNIHKVVMQLMLRYDKFVIISDNKESDSGYQVSLGQAKSGLKSLNIKAAYYTPTSMEEVLLSWLELPVYKLNTLAVELQQYYRTGCMPYLQDTTGKDIYTVYSNGYTGNNLELTLFNILVGISKYTYTKGYIHRCFFDNCCNYAYVLNMPMINNCNNKSKLNKVESIMKESIFGGLINCVNSVLGKKESYLNHWTQLQKEGLYEV